MLRTIRRALGEIGFALLTLVVFFGWLGFALFLILPWLIQHNPYAGVLWVFCVFGITTLMRNFLRDNC
jgi:hypothetical protein